MEKADRQRRILMTGADSGFGLTTCQYLRDRGHLVTTIGITPQADHQYDFMDLKGPAQTNYLAEQVSILAKEHDILINNAGTIELASFPAHLPSLYEEVWRVNAFAPYILMWAFYLGTREREPENGDFRIINTTSMATRMPPRQCVGYAASKAALELTTRALARELALEPYIFTCIAPGLVAPTLMQQKGKAWLVNFRGMSEEQADAYQAGVMERPINHEEIHNVFEFTVERMPKAMSGAVLPIPAAAGL